MKGQVEALHSIPADTRIMNFVATEGLVKSPNDVLQYGQILSYALIA